jgi:DNA-binding HxlR family transcriptional regulator
MHDSNTYPHDCGKDLAAIRDAIYVIGGKWRLQIIVAMRAGHHRFSDIQKTVTGISAKVLSSELKELELNGILKRRAHNNSHTVDYELTTYSESLGHVLQSLSEWGIQHKQKTKEDIKNSKTQSTY